MDHQGQISAKRSGLFPGCLELVNRSERTGAAGLDWLEDQFLRGGILIYSVYDAGRFVGIFTGYVEREYNRPTNFLVIHAVAAEKLGFPFIEALGPVITRLVKRSGLPSWSVRSDRPGMGRLLERNGFLKVETHYKKAV